LFYFNTHFSSLIFSLITWAGIPFFASGSCSRFFVFLFLFVFLFSYNIGKKFSVVKKELDKCVIVCKNCHAIIHHFK